MRILRTTFLSLLPLVLLAGCASSEFKDISVASSPDPKVNVSEYKTYAWRAAAAVVRDPENRWTPSNLDIGSEITFLVDRELTKRGLIKVVDQPNIYLIYAVGVDMDNLDVVSDPESGDEQMKNVPKGGVLVIMADPETRKVIWVGGATGDVQENPTPDSVKRRLDYAITEMFKDYPDGN